MMRLAWTVWAATTLTVTLTLGACGSSNGAPAAADAGHVEETSTTVDSGGGDVRDAGPTQEAQVPEAAGYPAFAPSDVPQVVSSGGPVMKTPKVVPIFYAADDSATVASLQDFLGKLPASPYWSAFATEYGVGAVSVAPAIMLTDTLPPNYDDSQIQAFLADKLQSADPAFPAPDANTIYAFFFPPNVTITVGATVPTGDAGDDAAIPADAGVAPGVSTSCNDFGGYHDNIALTTSTNVAYAVVPRCASFGPLMALDAITGPASHEIAEAATDPFPSGAPAFLSVDPTHAYWKQLLGGGEVGDMCAQGDVFTKFPPSMPYTVQRIWSNLAAKAGTDPCVPVPEGLTYFNTLPNMPDVLTITSRGGSVNPKGIEIPVGGSKTLELDLFSSAPMSDPWEVRILDLGYLDSTGTSPANTYLSATFMECQGAETCQGQNGDKLHVTLTVMQAGRRNYEPFIIESKLSSGHYNLWAGVVGSSPDGG
jgi:hypothetical protein